MSAIRGEWVAQNIIAMLPQDSLVAVTLKSRQAGETGLTSVAWAFAHKKPFRIELVPFDGGFRQNTWREFTLLKTTETVDPKSYDQITDDESITWDVKTVSIEMEGYVFNCNCLKQLTN